MSFYKTVRENDSDALSLQAANRDNVINVHPNPMQGEKIGGKYKTLEVDFDQNLKACRCYMRPPGRPSVTSALLQEMQDLQNKIKLLFAKAQGGEQPFQYFVFGSHFPGIFNLGGDLGMFFDRIRQGDRETMRRYAHAATETVYQNANAFHQPIITMALVQGDALGGGFEAALSYDIIIAEKSAKLGFPEILFNMFPGMGAYTFLSRRISPALTEKMIMSGQIYTAGELHAMGIVDVLAEDGGGEQAVRDYISANARKFNAHQALLQARRRVKPVTREEMYDVVDIWVEAALRLKEPDLRKMERLVAAQNRRLTLAAAVPRVAAE